LLQATSAAFTGGAAVLPPVQAEVTEQTPLLQDRRRRQDAAEQVQQRLVMEFMSIVSLCKVWLVLLVMLMIAAALAVTILFVQAIIATIFNQDKPCDQPLKYYMIATLLWSQVPSWGSSFASYWLPDGEFWYMAYTWCKVPRHVERRTQIYSFRWSGLFTLRLRLQW